MLTTTRCMQGQSCRRGIRNVAAAVESLQSCHMALAAAELREIPGMPPTLPRLALAEHAVVVGLLNMSTCSSRRATMDAVISFSSPSM